MEKAIPRARIFRRLKILTRREARVVQAVAETLFPSEGTDMPSVAEAQVVEYFDEMLSHLEFKERMLIRSLVALLEFQPLVFIGRRPCLFTQATLDERTKNLAAWETSSVFQRRLVFMAIRTMLLWAYADSQAVEREMGFVPGTERTAQRKATQLAELAHLLQKGADHHSDHAPHETGAMVHTRELSPQQASAKEHA